VLQCLPCETEHVGENLADGATLKPTNQPCLDVRAHPSEETFETIPCLERVVNTGKAILIVAIQ